MRQTRNKLLVTTAVLAAGITIAAAQGLPGGGAGGAGGRQEHQQSQSTQGRGGQAQERGQQGREQGRQQGQAQRSESQRNQTTGQSQRNEGNRQGQAEQQRNPVQGKQGQAEQLRNQGQSKQGQAEQQRNQAQSKQGQAERGRQQPDQTTGQGQRDQGQAQTPRNQPTERQAPQRDQGQAQQNQAQQNQAQRQSGSVNLTAEQRTRIQQTVLTRRDVPRVDRVDFALRAGSPVPRRVRVVEVPDTLIEIHPQWRGHRYFVVRDEIVIVDSGYRIVDTLPVSSSSSSALDTDGGAQLSNGDDGINLSVEEIRQVQIVLREKGFFDGEPDGVFGPRTRQALIAFQQRQGLQATGRIDVQTTAALGISNKSGNLPSTTGQGGNEGGNQGRMQPPANQDVGNAQPSTGGNSPSQKMDQGNSNMNENSDAAPRSAAPAR
jgi:hypothetical protein